MQSQLAIAVSDCTDSIKMSETSVEKYDGFCSQINEKPVDAIGHMIFRFDFDHFESPFLVEKVFGLTVKEPNLVLKFKLVVKEWSPKESYQEFMKFQLIYVNEESIECKFEESYRGLEIQKHLNIGDELVSFVYQLDELKFDPRVIFSIGLSLVISHQERYNLISRKFNDPFSSDFIIECQNEKFYVHQMILKDQSEYFEAILRNDCKENDEKKMIIDDFEPKVVEIFLRHIYNGAVYENGTDDTKMAVGLMKMADKYNFTSLYDTIDSQFAQYYAQLIPSEKAEEIQHQLSNLKDDLQICEETGAVGAPKLSAMIFLKRSKVKDACKLSDNEWSNLIRQRALKIWQEHLD